MRSSPTAPKPAVLVTPPRSFPPDRLGRLGVPGPLMACRRLRRQAMRGPGTPSRPRRSGGKERGGVTSTAGFGAVGELLIIGGYPLHPPLRVLVRHLLYESPGFLCPIAPVLSTKTCRHGILLGPCGRRQ